MYFKISASTFCVGSKNTVLIGGVRAKALNLVRRERICVTSGKPRLVLPINVATRREIRPGWTWSTTTAARAATATRRKKMGNGPHDRYRSYQLPPKRIAPAPSLATRRTRDRGPGPALSAKTTPPRSTRSNRWKQDSGA